MPPRHRQSACCGRASPYRSTGEPCASRSRGAFAGKHLRGVAERFAALVAEAAPSTTVVVPEPGAAIGVPSARRPGRDRASAGVALPARLGSGRGHAPDRRLAAARIPHRRWAAALAAALLLGLLNALVWPVLVRLLLPLTVITLGLAPLVLNAGMVALVALGARRRHASTTSGGASPSRRS